MLLAAGLALFLTMDMTTRLAGQENASSVTVVPSRPTGVIIKRRDHLTEEELRKQLLQVPEIDLDQDLKRSTSAKLANLAGMSEQAQHHQRATLLQRPDLTGLPLRKVFECRLTKEAAADLEGLSHRLRTYRGDLDAVRQELLETESGDTCVWLQPKAVPVLTQMLQAERQSVRLLLVGLLARIPGKPASVALAQRALFDLSPEVRTEAIQGLSRRPLKEYRTDLMEGLRHPWAPAADHAAEALVSLQVREAVPLLVALWKEPNPTIAHDARKGSHATARELVRVNHLRNCTLCHAVSRDRNDPVRGRVPVPGESLPPTNGTEYYQGHGTFARADITYLRQDFSVPQPVESPGSWPAVQRYDYLVKTRLAGRDDFDRKQSARHHEAILFALEGLGADRRRLLPPPAKSGP